MRQLPNNLESPFLDEEIQVAEPHQELEPWINGLADENRFERASIQSDEAYTVSITERADQGHQSPERERLTDIESEAAYEYWAKRNEEFKDSFTYDEPEVAEMTVEEEESENLSEHLGLADEAERSLTVEHIIEEPKPARSSLTPPTSVSHPAASSARSKYRFQVLDWNGQPLANTQWAIYQDDKVFAGALDAKGWNNEFDTGWEKFNGSHSFKLHVEGHVCMIVRGAA